MILRLGSAIVLAGALSVALGAAGCQSVQHTGQVLEERIAIFEQGEVPGRARQYASLSFTDVEHRAVRGDAWARFELARRLELGIGRTADVQCAVYWYSLANRTSYMGRDPPPSRSLSSYAQVGMPHARAAVRRLITADPSAAAAIDPRFPETVVVEDRCSAQQRNREYLLADPVPLPGD